MLLRSETLAWSEGIHFFEVYRFSWHRNVTKWSVIYHYMYELLLLDVCRIFHLRSGNRNCRPNLLFSCCLLLKFATWSAPIFTLFVKVGEHNEVVSSEGVGQWLSPSSINCIQNTIDRSAVGVIFIYQMRAIKKMESVIFRTQIFSLTICPLTACEVDEYCYASYIHILTIFNCHSRLLSAIQKKLPLVAIVVYPFGQRPHQTLCSELREKLVPFFGLGGHNHPFFRES